MNDEYNLWIELHGWRFHMLWQPWLGSEWKATIERRESATGSKTVWGLADCPSKALSRALREAGIPIPTAGELTALRDLRQAIVEVTSARKTHASA